MQIMCYGLWGKGSRDYHQHIMEFDNKIEGAKIRTIWAKFQEAIESNNLTEKFTAMLDNGSTFEIRDFANDTGFNYWSNIENGNIVDSIDSYIAKRKN